jgi:hypothetical protein
VYATSTDSDLYDTDCSKYYVPTTTINALPDGVLLEIFHFCRMGHDAYGFPFRPILEWRRLIHVCQRWRYIIFESPLQLDLQLLCTHGTPVRKNLCYWPPVPLTIDYYTYWDADQGEGPTPSYEDDVIAALEHPGRVRYVGISVTSSLLGKMSVAMQEPFPMLTHLWLSSKDGNVPVLPETFLGRSAPHLRVAHLEGIPFPALPTLLLSATDLVELQLLNIPETGYLPPDVMVASLVALVRLEILSIGFQSPTSFPDPSPQPPSTRVIFPLLSTFTFRGVSEYLEYLVVQIDTPLLKNLTIVYFNQLPPFYLHQLSHFIHRTEGLELHRFKHARVEFSESYVSVNLYEGYVEPESLDCHFTLQISCECLDWQILHMTDVLGQCSAVLLSQVDDVFIDTYDLRPGWRADEYVEPTEWLELLNPFRGMKILRVSKQLTTHVTLALEDMTEENVAEMLPALRSLCLGGKPEASVEQYIGARVRQISSHLENVSITPG